MKPPIFLDVSARVIDARDEHRLFAFPQDAAQASALLDAVTPSGGGVAVIAPPTYYALAEGVGDIRRVNDFVLAQAAARPTVAGAIGVVEPRHLDEAHVELGRLARAGALGIVLSPRAHGLLADDKLLVETVRAAHGAGLRCAIQAHPYSANESFDRILRLGRACGEVPLLVMGALMSWETGQSILGGLHEPNLSFEVGGLIEGVPFASLVKVLGEDRVLYGSGGREAADRQFEAWRGRLEEADLSEEATEKFLWRNAARWLGFEGGRA